MSVGDYHELESGGRLGLDIETISPTVPQGESPDFEDPDDFELLATGLIYEPPGESVSAARETLLWRDGIDAAGEAEHARKVAATILAADPHSIVTYNGDRFDFRHLLGRAKRACFEVGERTAFAAMGRALDRTHLDLLPSAWDCYGRYTSLEKLVTAQNLTVRRTRFTSFDHGYDLSYRGPMDPPYVEGSDVPTLGEALLRTRAGIEHSVNTEPMTAMLADYALGDIEHLLRLADSHPF